MAIVMHYLCIPCRLVNVLVDAGEHEGDHEREAGREEEEPQPALYRMPSALGNILKEQPVKPVNIIQATPASISMLLGGTLSPCREVSPQ